ncbi:MAG: response regulator transcription factor [Burkholderiaceae bacterium]
MRLLLIDDHPLYRSATASALRAHSAIETLSIDEADGVTSALAMPHDIAFDGVVLDLHMADFSGLEAFAAVAQRFDGTRIVILSSDDSIDTVCELIDAGAAGYVFKTAHGDQVADDIFRALAGELRLPESVARELSRRFLKPRSTTDVQQADSHSAAQPLDSVTRMALALGLTMRQSEVLHGMHAGGSNKHIARQLDITERTVKFHLSAAYDILGARNRTDALVIMQRAGFPLSTYRPAALRRPT